MNKDLRIFKSSNYIIETVENNPVTIIVAETGAGKSTQVPQYLLEAGYNLVVTEPRRLAARTVSMRVAEEYSVPLGGTVGYRTAFEREDSPETRCLFVTDGLALVREMMGFGWHNVLILDEVHEWNTNVEVLVAWSKLQMSRGANFKLILMSATIEHEALSKYFDGAPVIKIPGEQYPIQELGAGKDILHDITKLAHKGKNILVFQPGKKEIAETLFAIKEDGLNVIALPLHGDLTPEEQDKCFKSYVLPKVIVSTNVAQTSITVPDIDAVIDCGYERRIELKDGIEGLYTRPISMASRQQRKGRAGRTKPGIYIDHCDEDNRPKYQKAEILRCRLDQSVLRLAEAGFDMSELDFVHQPQKKEIKEAKRSLLAIGCLDKRGAVTPRGHEIAKMPISPKFGRMVIEAQKRDVVGEVVTIAAIMEAGDLGLHKSTLWRQWTKNERRSDVIAQLHVFMKAETLTVTEDNVEFIACGINAKRFVRAKETRDHLGKSLEQSISFTWNPAKRDDVLKCVIAGMVDHLYSEDCGAFQGLNEVDKRRLSYDCVIPQDSDLIVGLPFDLELIGNYGPYTINLISMCTVVEAEWLEEVAPNLIEVTRSDLFFNPENDRCFYEKNVSVNGQIVQSFDIEEFDPVICSKKFAEWIAGQVIGSGLKEMKNLKLLEVIKSMRAARNFAKDLNSRANNCVFKVHNLAELTDCLFQKLSGAASRREIQDYEALKVNFLDQSMVQQIYIDHPNSIEIIGQKWSVQYVENGAMAIVFDWSCLHSCWTELPDVIPQASGRKIRFSVTVHDKKLKSTNLESLKKSIASHLNERKWKLWKRPTVDVPDLSVEGATIPDVVSEEYGRCDLSGQTLFGYRVLEPDFKEDRIVGRWKWFWNAAEADKVLGVAREKFSKYR